jgi:hypothetical protein
MRVTAVRTRSLGGEKEDMKLRSTASISAALALAWLVAAQCLGCSLGKRAKTHLRAAPAEPVAMIGVSACVQYHRVSESVGVLRDAQRLPVHAGRDSGAVDAGSESLVAWISGASGMVPYVLSDTAVALLRVRSGWRPPEQLVLALAETHSNIEEALDLPDSSMAVIRTFRPAMLREDTTSASWRGNGLPMSSSEMYCSELTVEDTSAPAVKALIRLVALINTSKGVRPLWQPDGAVALVRREPRASIADTIRVRLLSMPDATLSVIAEADGRVRRVSDSLAVLVYPSAKDDSVTAILLFDSVRARSVSETSLELVLPVHPDSAPTSLAPRRLYWVRPSEAISVGNLSIPGYYTAFIFTMRNCSPCGFMRSEHYDSWLRRNPDLVIVDVDVASDADRSDAHPSGVLRALKSLTSAGIGTPSVLLFNPYGICVNRLDELDLHRGYRTVIPAAGYPRAVALMDWLSSRSDGERNVVGYEDDLFDDGSAVRQLHELDRRRNHYADPRHSR